MPRSNKCNACKKNKKKQSSHRKHNKSHKKHLNVLRGGMEGSSSKKNRTHPEWWDLAVQGTHPHYRQYINNDAIFVSFTEDIGVEAQTRFIEEYNELLRPHMFITSYRFGCDAPHSVIVATNTTLVLPKTLASLCKNSIQFMYPFDLYSFGRTAPPRINLFIQYHNRALSHKAVVPIGEYYID
jgi:hypothetical protein